jgi:hypothetical protein
MATLNDERYVTTKLLSGGANRGLKGSRKDWFLVRENGNRGWIQLSHILLPPEYVGKRIKLKLEMKDGTDDTMVIC